MTEAQTLPTISGVIEDYTVKEGTNNNGAWTKHGVKLSNDWYSTFSDTDGSLLAQADETGQSVFITYAVSADGKYNNIQSVAVHGQAPATAAQAAPVGTSAATKPAASSELEQQAVMVAGDKIVDLSEYESQGFLVIYPTEGYIREVSKHHIVRLETIHPKKDDFYEQGSGLAPNKQLLLKVADAGGLRWDPDRCGYETNLPTIKVFKAVGHTRLADGSFKAIIGHKEVDLEVEIGEIEERAESLLVGPRNNKRAASAEEKASYVKKETLRIKKHAGSNCETKAYLRAVRAAFQLPGTFTSEEIKKPWLIPRIDFQPDFSNPQIQSQMIDRGVSAAGELYSAPPVTYPTPTATQNEECGTANESEGGNDDDVPF